MGLNCGTKITGAVCLERLGAVMYRFYVEPNQIGEGDIKITGSDVNHIKNVLRMKPGEKIIICDGQGKDFYCIIREVSAGQITAEILKVQDTDTELKGKLYLFQGIPKKDKMELIVQKAVELGVYEIIIPVVTVTKTFFDNQYKTGYHRRYIHRAGRRI